MARVPVRYLLLAVLAGCVWGAIGLALGGQALGDSIWGSLLAAPVIGVLVAVAFRGFRGRPLGVRIALSLVSLYLAAGLFALAAGFVEASRPIPGRVYWAVVTQTVVGVWWGITFTGYLVVLWPLAYLTHALLGRADARISADTGK